MCPDHGPSRARTLWHQHLFHRTADIKRTDATRSEPWSKDELVLPMVLTRLGH